MKIANKYNETWDGIPVDYVYHYFENIFKKDKCYSKEIREKFSIDTLKHDIENNDFSNYRICQVVSSNSYGIFYMPLKVTFCEFLILKKEESFGDTIKRYKYFKEKNNIWEL